MSDIFSLVYEFPSKTKAGQAFNAVRNLIHLHTCELGGYRTLVNGNRWLVIVVGEKPTLTLEKALVKALETFGGKEEQAPEGIVAALYFRHFAQTYGRGQEWNEESYDN